MRTLLRLSLVLLSACSGSAAPAPAPASPPAPNEAPAVVAADPPTAIGATLAGRSLFCAYGGVGVVPDPLPPGYETMFVSMVVEIDNPGPPITGVTVVAASLRDASGATLAPLLRVDHFVDLSGALAPDPTWGSFAVYLNPEGTPFSGALPTGRTRLRLRYSISPGLTAYPDHCRLELGGIGAAPLVIEGGLDGSWPTS